MQDEALLLTITDACGRLNLGRSKIYELIGSGEIPVVRVGRAVRIPASGLVDFVERLERESREELVVG